MALLVRHARSALARAGVRARPLSTTLGVLLGLLVALCSLTAGAADGDSGDLLRVDQAFAPSAYRQGPHTLVVRWQIADGYYLYRHALSFSLEDAKDARLGAPVIPQGARHDDEYFGPVETYRHTLRVRLPVDGLPKAGARLQVQYQGCADAGLCYPPQTRSLAIADPPTTGADPGPPIGVFDGPDPTTSPTPGPVSQTASQPSSTSSPSGMLATRLAEAPIWSVLGLFLVLGLGLAFTPCILPMVPIVAGLIGSRDVSRGHALALTLAYVLAMAAAYTVFGLVAGYFGANLQAALQRPLVLLPFAGLFVVLGTASFGWFDLQIPGIWQARLSRIGAGRKGLGGAAAIGFASALIAGPCLAPPLAGALLYISTSGDLVTGGAALFCLGLGMGMPLIALALFGASVLPRTGPWMQEIRVFFGVMLIAVGFWLGLRLAPSDVALLLWGLLALVYAVYLSTRVSQATPTRMAQRIAVALLAGYAALAGAGLAIGEGRPGAPLAGLGDATTDRSSVPGKSANRPGMPMQRVTRAAGLHQALAAAARAHRPALVDVYADWCVECVQMKHTVFTDPAVQAALEGVSAIEFDVTDYTADQRKTLRALGVFGPPTLLFYGSDGQERTARRAVGRIDATTLRRRLFRLDARAS